MKKKYETPKVEVITIEAEKFLATSECRDDGLINQYEDGASE